MKDNIIDARGRACPEPVLMTKKAIEMSRDGIKVIVDNVTARENIRRFASNSGYTTDVVEQDEDFIISLRKK